MRKANSCDSRRRSHEINDLSRYGEEGEKRRPEWPDFLARLKKIYGAKPLKVSRVKLSSGERERF
jgi:hypothetical protein